MATKYEEPGFFSRGRITPEPGTTINLNAICEEMSSDFDANGHEVGYSDEPNIHLLVTASSWTGLAIQIVPENVVAVLRCRDFSRSPLARLMGAFVPLILVFVLLAEWKEMLGRFRGFVHGSRLLGDRVEYST